MNHVLTMTEAFVTRAMTANLNYSMVSICSWLWWIVPTSKLIRVEWELWAISVHRFVQIIWQVFAHSDLIASKSISKLFWLRISKVWKSLQIFLTQKTGSIIINLEVSITELLLSQILFKNKQSVIIVAKRDTNLHTAKRRKLIGARCKKF
jgi:hypothetical protein